MSEATCSDPRHALRSALPGWSATLGTATATSPIICNACATGRVVESVEDANDPRSSFELAEGGAYTFRLVRRYSDGALVALEEYPATIAERGWTAAKRAAFRAYLVELRDFAKNKRGT